jgi:hypothetical protein
MAVQAGKENAVTSVYTAHNPVSCLSTTTTRCLFTAGLHADDGLTSQSCWQNRPE